LRAEKCICFFNNVTVKNLAESACTDDIEAVILYDVIRALSSFGRLYFQVIKVNQLGAINNNQVLPINVHSETGSYVMKGCLPVFMGGHGEMDEDMFLHLCRATDSINIALKAIIPDLQIDIRKVSEEISDSGKKSSKFASDMFGGR